ncbi:hypothetical protein HHI36_023910 [Cryptolaemus montrouzieri]|uniref:Retrotransposon gag domain-containing protein n=1 Tax=Cryptolaemus montrouzieri TaxID=559131 RepID=A0ABD2N1K2_9CUCU
MNPNHLKAEELEYEITIRGAKPPNKVDEKRKTLRGLIAQETSHRGFYIIEVPFSFEEDKNTLRLSLDQVTELVIIRGKRSKSTLYPKNDLQENIHKTLQSELLSLKEDLAEKIEPKLTGAVLSHSTPIAPIPNAQQTTPQFSFNKKIPINKWGIKKFSDEGSLVRFLEHIESLRIPRSCSDSDLLESASDLFESHAWTWWHNNHIKQRFSDWNDLVRGLNRNFLPENYDKSLLDEIKSRKQDSREQISISRSSLESQFNRLANSIPGRYHKE